MTNADMKLILASQSPRRKDLLQRAGYSFEVIPPRDGVECGSIPRASPQEFVARLAYQKAADVAGRCGQAIIIGCDTVAECDGHILGKPTDRAHARQMLKLMSGRTHHVYSGLCLWRNPDKRTLVKVAATKLQMNVMLDDTLEKHLASNRWQGKAGAFGFQEGMDWVRILAGSESNVVGLPMELFAKMLAEIRS